MDELSSKILRKLENPTPCSAALVTTSVCASVFLRNVRMGKLGLVPNSLGMNLTALPLWFLDWLLDMATGGAVKSFIHTMRIAMRGPLSVSSDVENGNENSAGRVNPQVVANHGKLITSPDSDVFTLHDLVTKAFNKFSDWPCVGSRELLEYRPNPSGSGPPVKVFGETKWLTYAEVQQMSLDFGLGLRSCGLAPQRDTDYDANSGLSSLCIFENTCPGWLIAALGCFSQSLCVTTVYATLGLKALVSVVNEGRLKVIMCNQSVAKDLAALKDEMPTLTHLILSDDNIAKADLGSDEKIEVEGLRILTYDELLRKGRVRRGEPPVKPREETVAVVMYTSGSTGNPKGVVIEHQALVATVAGVRGQGKYYDTSGVKSRADTVVCYLPLAHIFELANELVCLSCGASLGFACPRSLSSDLCVPNGAFECYRPTFMVAVPKVLDVLRKSILTKVKAASPVKKFLFESAFAARMNSASQGRNSPLFDLLMFRKLRKALGGRLKTFVTGGAPLNLETQRFMETAFNTYVLAGYGLTETCGIVSANAFEPGTIAGTCGPPVVTIRPQLVSCDIEDKNGNKYLSTDRIDENGNKCFGRGEIVVSGANLSSRYFKQPEVTKAAFSYINGVRHFATGDIGCWRSDGTLAIVDRKKNLVKLAGGEYVALEFMEMVFGNCDVVDAVLGGVMVYADGTMDKSVALVQPNKQAIESWAKENLPNESDYSEILKSKLTTKFVMDQLNAEGKRCDLGRNGLIGRVGLIHDYPWTPLNGCLTATNKVQRRAIQQAHSQQLKDLILTQQIQLSP